MNNVTLRKVRVFYCKRGRDLAPQVTDILNDLDIPLDIDADPGPKPSNPHTDIAIGIWADGTRTDADFFRELGAWDSRANTDIFICRLRGPKVDCISPEVIRGIHNFDGEVTLKEWLLRDVLQIDEAEYQGPTIDSLEAAIRHYNKEFRQRLQATEVLNGMHGVEKKPLVDAYVPLSLKGKAIPSVVADFDIVDRLFQDDGRRIFVTGVPGSGKSTLAFELG